VADRVLPLSAAPTDSKKPLATVKGVTTELASLLTYCVLCFLTIYMLLAPR
jgi:hypothetical protein